MRRRLCFIIIVAAIVRLGWIALDWKHYTTADWKWDGRLGLAAALSDRGNDRDFGYAALQMDRDEVQQGWLLNDRGQYYIHRAIAILSGHTGFLQIVLLQSFIDLLMVFAIFDIGLAIGGNNVASLAGVSYALFLPQVFLVTMPAYDCWLTFALVVGTWLYIRNKGPIITAAALFGLSQVRSIAALFMTAIAAWEILGARRISRHSIVTIGASMLLLGTLSICNYVTRGELSPVRSTTGHSFWVGVGQFSNPYVDAPTDGAVGAFYRRETGIADTGNTMGLEYNRWLSKRAWSFVAENPIEYARMTIVRVVRIVVPNLPPAIVPNEAWTWLPIVAFRGLLMFGLPLGLLAALILTNDRAIVWPAILPLAYIVVVTAPIEAHQLVNASAWAAMLPVVALGWTRFAKVVATSFPLATSESRR